MTQQKLHLKSFRGRWRLSRTLRDIKGGSSGTLQGTATFSATDGPDLLEYNEVGQLFFDGGPPLQAQRRYRWRCGKGVIKVEFEDGRPFHQIDLNATMPFATHFCGDDVYDVTYDFRAWRSWECSWFVRGPRKEYRLVTTYAYIGRA